MKLEIPEVPGLLLKEIELLIIFLRLLRVVIVDRNILQDEPRKVKNATSTEYDGIKFKVN